MGTFENIFRCKIIESTIGPNCVIRQECSLVECNAAAGCIIDAGKQF